MRVGSIGSYHRHRSHVPRSFIIPTFFFISFFLLSFFLLTLPLLILSTMNHPSKTKPTVADLKVATQLSQLGEPPSPTMSTTSFLSSVSWMAEKSSSDLIPLLKNAYHTLKDRERGKFLG